MIQNILNIPRCYTSTLRISVNLLSFPQQPIPSQTWVEYRTLNRQFSRGIIWSATCTLIAWNTVESWTRSNQVTGLLPYICTILFEPDFLRLVFVISYCICILYMWVAPIVASNTFRKHINPTWWQRCLKFTLFVEEHWTGIPLGDIRQRTTIRISFR